MTCQVEHRVHNLTKESKDEGPNKILLCCTHSQEERKITLTLLTCQQTANAMYKPQKKQGNPPFPGQ